MGTRFGTSKRHHTLIFSFLPPIPPHPHFFNLFLYLFILPRVNNGERCEIMGIHAKSHYGSADHPPPASWRTCVCNLRLRCCKGISTSASALRVTRVRRALQTLLVAARPARSPRALTLAPSDLSIAFDRRRHSVLYQYTQSARRTFHDLCVPLPPNLFLLTPHLIRCGHKQCVSKSSRMTEQLS
jgi:hypothetical protein